MNAPFLPTTCACKEDQANCKRQPGHLLPGQVGAILAHLKETDASKFFWSSPGMLARRVSDGVIERIRTITPKMSRGRCVFLTDAGACSIHAVAPYGCRFFDVHMNQAEGQRRSLWGAHQIIDRMDEYKKERDGLPIASSYKPRSAM